MLIWLRLQYIQRTRAWSQLLTSNHFRPTERVTDLPPFSFLVRTTRRRAVALQRRRRRRRRNGSGVVGVGGSNSRGRVYNEVRRRWRIQLAVATAARSVGVSRSLDRSMCGWTEGCQLKLYKSLSQFQSHFNHCNDVGPGVVCQPLFNKSAEKLILPKALFLHCERAVGGVFRRRETVLRTESERERELECVAGGKFLVQPTARTRTAACRARRRPANQRGKFAVSAGRRFQLASYTIAFSIYCSYLHHARLPVLESTSKDAFFMCM